MDRNEDAEHRPVDIGDMTTIGSTLDARNRGTSAPGEFQEGQLLGAYRLIRRLGRGGFGEVWEAVNTTTHRRLALKVLTQARSASQQLLDRFQREGKLAASVNHPRCVFIFTTEQVEGYPAITMELMAGGTLQDLIEKRGALPHRKAVDMMLDVIEGLEAAARVGILHRDIKPSNCFVDESGRCKIGDFGISKSLQSVSDLTIQGGFVGTPSYSSPEQILGRDLDSRSDIYSVGATLYALLTARPPFSGKDAAETLARIVAEEPEPFAGSDIPKALQRLVLRTLSKDKEKRFRSFDEVRRALLSFSSNGLTAGSLIKRFIAFALDLSLMSVLTGTVLRSWGTTWAAILSFGSLMLYFTVCEKFWGRTIGKYLLGLRVTTTTGTPITFLNAISRTFVFNSIISGLPLLMAWLFPALSSGIRVVGLLRYLVLVSMRSENGFAGLHEVLSKTRVMAVRKQRESLVVPVLQPPLLSVGAGACYGPYLVRGTLWRTESEALLAGHDELLNRAVWIHELPPGAPESMAAMTAVRPGRLRWLQGARDPALNWDAYEAPPGIGFCEWVSRKGMLSWTEVRRILFDVANEISAQTAQGDSSVLSAQRIWIDANGTAKLTHFRVCQSAEPLTTGFKEYPLKDWAQFLHEICYFALAGSLRDPGPQVGIPAAPLPEHARPLVHRICTPGGGFRSFTGVVGGSAEENNALEGFASPSLVAAELERTAERPARITRIRRAMPAAAASVPAFLMIAAIAAIAVIITPTLAWMGKPWMGDLLNAQQYLNQLRSMGDDVEIRIRKHLAFSYMQAALSPDGRRFLSLFSNEMRTDLSSSAMAYPKTRGAEVSPVPMGANDLKNHWMEELLYTIWLYQQVDQNKLDQAAKGVGSEAMAKVLSQAHNQTRAAPEGGRWLAALSPGLQQELESAARTHPGVTPSEAAAAGTEITMLAWRQLSPSGAPLVPPSWLSGLKKAPQYRLQLAGVFGPLNFAANPRADAIRKVMAYSYVQAHQSSEGPTLLQRLSPEVREALESAAKRYPQLSQNDADEARREIPLAGVYRMLRNPAEIARFFVFTIGVTGIFAGFLAVALAAIMRTGPLLRAAGFSIQTPHGLRAGRLRCTLRAVVTWIPFLVLPIVGMRALVSPFAIMMVIVSLAGFIYSIMKPERGIPDLIAGTYLVPK